MSKHHEKQMKLRRSLSEQIVNIFANTERFQWSHLDLNHVIGKMRAGHQWKSLTGPSQEYLNGKIDLLRSQIEKEIVPAYFIGGKFLTIRSDEYRKIDPIRVNAEYSHTCAWVWKENPQRVYSGYKEEVHLLD